MRIVHAETPTDFAEAALRFLLEDETTNGALIAPLVAPGAPTALGESEIAFTSVCGGRVRLAGLRRTGRGLVLSSGDREAARLAACDLAARNVSVELISGPTEMVRAFAQSWRERTGAAFRTLVAFHLLDSRAVRMPTPADGHMRLAEAGDVETLTDWLMEFIAEALPHETSSLSASLAGVRSAIAARRIYVWESSGEIQGMASWSRPTPKGIAINGVHTPSRFRRRGVAANLVARLSAQQLAAGKEFCCLYTDQRNPVSNRVYERIGYARRGDSELIRIGDVG